MGEPTGTDFAKALFETLVEGTKLSNAMPAADEHEYAATFPAFTTAMGGIEQQLNGMVHGLMQQQPSHAQLSDLSSAQVNVASRSTSSHFQPRHSLSHVSDASVRVSGNLHGGGGGLWCHGGGG